MASESLPVVADLADVQPGTEHQQGVGVLHGEVAGAFADGAGAAAEELIFGGDDVVRPGGGDRNAEQMNDTVEFFDSTRGAYTGTGHDDGPGGGADALDDLAAFIGKQLGIHRQIVLGGIVGGEVVLIDHGGLDIDGDVEPAGSGTSGAGEVKSS